MAKDESHVDRYVCEFVGTFILVLTVVCNVINGNPFGAISIACVLMVSVYSMGGISGGHFNPAVTFAVTVAGKFDLNYAQALIYVLIQCVGGCLGAIVGFAIYGHSFNFAPGTGFSGTHAVVVEFLYTAMLALVVMNTACSKEVQGNQYYGLAIGFVIVAGGYAAGPVSGGALNPAVALGIEVAGLANKHPFGWCLPYAVVQLAAGGVAALLHRVVRPAEYGGSAQDVMAKYVAEFIGTFYLVFTVGLNVMGGAAAGVFSIASSLMVMIYAFGDISGAHFNPAVTLAILFSGRNKVSSVDAAIYIAVQILGGLAAGLVYYSVYGHTFALGPKGTFSWGAVAAAEISFTAVLCFVVLCVATTTKATKEFFGFAIGMCVTVGGYAIGGVSGGSLNPAVSIGIDTVHAIVAHQYWQNCLAYSGLEIVGAAVAAGAFYIVHYANEYGENAKK